MVFVKRFAAILSAAILAAWPGALVRAQAPDLILHNGKVVTVDPEFSIAQALAIRGDRFVAVGTNDAVRRTAGPATKALDLRGRTVIPGLIDGHLHNAGGGPGVDLAGVRSMAELLAAVEARVKASKGISSSPTPTGTRRSCARSACRTRGTSTASLRTIRWCWCAAGTSSSSTRPR